MIKKFMAASAFAFAASVATPAMAQDDVPFDGPYIAALGGYDKVQIDTPFGNGNDDGFLYGGVIGFDKNIGGAVFGVEGEYSDSTTKETVSNLVATGDSASLRTGRDLYAGVRIGGEIVPNVMLYGKGGYTNTRVTGTYDDGVDVISDSANLDGYRLGAGVETSIRGFITRVEYRYSDYGKYEGTGIEPDRHQVAAMLGYRF